MKRGLLQVAGLLLASACGHHAPSAADASVSADASVDAPADARPDAPPPCTTCQLLAVEPAIADAGDTVTLEGTFDGSATVTFPGAPAVPATVLGAHRASVAVPASATAGDLVVSTGGVTTAGVTFRRASFQLGVQNFTTSTGGADRQTSSLVVARDRHSTVVVGNTLYVIGGSSGGSGTTTPLAEVESATINADGSLGPFAPATSTLVEARAGHTSVTIGGYVYVIGGLGVNGPLATVERAAIAADGTLGPFSTLAGVTLAVPRDGASTAVLGDQLYVIGGESGSPLASVERATIAPDGSLGPFAVVTGVALQTATSYHASAVVGGYLYVLGGLSAGGTPVARVERAAIAGDGGLGAFTSIANASLTSPRAHHGAVILGSSLCVFGDATTAIECAQIQGDDTIGPFSAATGIALDAPRVGATFIIAEDYVYAIGGMSGGADVASIGRASIDASGTLATLVAQPTTKLVTGREYYASTTVGRRLYVIGGVGNVDYLTSVESATLGTDGTLGAFTVASTTLTAPRGYFTTAIVGNSLYVIGGDNGTTVLASVERAPIASDGSLGKFAIVPGVTLSTARYGHTSAVIGPYVYIMSGHDATPDNELTSVERATINADGSLSTFSTVAGVTLATGHGYSTCEIVGSSLYVIGGDGNYLAGPGSVQSAPIHPDGSLGTFTNVAGNALVSPRLGHASAIIGQYLYVVGGSSEMFDDVSSIERALINADGSLGPFATVPGVTVSAPVTGPTGATLGNAFYLVGGSTTPGVSLTTVQQGGLL